MTEEELKDLQRKRVGFIPSAVFRVVGSTFRDGQAVLKAAQRYHFPDQTPPAMLEAEIKNPAYPRICEGCGRQGKCQYQLTGGCAVKVLIGTEVTTKLGEAPLWRYGFAGYVPKALEADTSDGKMLVRELVDRKTVVVGVDWISGPAQPVDNPHLGCQIGIRTVDPPITGGG